jgi:hypothetical protein
MTKLFCKSEPQLATAYKDQFAAYIAEAVAPFNTRNFTNQSDLVSAFAGIAHFLTYGSSLQSIYSRGLCWGLPLAYFPHALTWTTRGEELRLRNRDLGFPSWSWLAWEGEVTAERSFFPAASAIKSIMRIEPQQVKSICEWEIAPSVLNHTMTSEEVPYPRQVRLLAQHCFVRPNAGALRQGTATGRPFHWISMEINRPAYMLADSVVAACYFADSVELVGISKFQATVVSEVGLRSTTRRGWFIKALWVARVESTPPGNRANGTEPRFSRRGVAIVHQDLWDMYVLRGGQRIVTVLE